MCHNDVIDAGHNNRLFAPGTDMDRERLCLSHMQNGTDNVQICDKAEILLKVALTIITIMLTGADPGFQVRGAHL